jgi:hypothetical protein
MEATVQGVVVFGLASGAHLEIAHGRLGAIVRHILNYGEAWATIGAVSEGVTMTAVIGTQKFTQARLAGGNVRRDELVFSFLSNTMADFKAFIANGRVIASGYIFNTG